jgi:hypothetical protein
MEEITAIKPGPKPKREDGELDKIRRLRGKKAGISAFKTAYTSTRGETVMGEGH